ncbi:hypothetical protein OS187_11320 [Xanthomonadaceae bacterium JHOS43]|nr:hypothetical protein [Xanthomonadaceae bacterium JHOS43]
MSATLIAVVLALILGHAVAPLARLRRYGWFDAWLELGQRQAGAAFASPFAILISLGLPLLLGGWLQSALDGRFFGIPGFLFAVAVLIYCWGPRDLDIDVEAIEEAPDEAARERAIGQLAGEQRPPAANDEAGLVTAVFAGARRRWFGVLFWFLLLGPFGALLYRLAERGAGASAGPLPPAHAAAYRHLLAILDWPVAHLMALALAIAGNFDAVHGAWRDWHHARRDLPFDFSTGFLDAAALAGERQSRREASVERALDAESGLDVPDEVPPDAPAALPAMHAAMSLVWRILTVWLVVVALFVLAGYV